MVDTGRLRLVRLRLWPAVAMDIDCFGVSENKVTGPAVLSSSPTCDHSLRHNPVITVAPTRVTRIRKTTTGGG